MANLPRERPRKIDARKAIYAGLKPARMVLGGDKASASLLRSQGVITEDTHQVWLGSIRLQGANGPRLGAKPTSILNAITRWAPEKPIDINFSFDLLDLDIGETFPISLGRWLEKNASNIADDGVIVLWVARQFRSQEVLTFHEWFDSFWRRNEHLVKYRTRVAKTINSPNMDNVTLNTMLLLACSLSSRSLSFTKAISYVDGWSMVAIRAEMSYLSSSQNIPAFSELVTSFYSSLSTEPAPQQDMLFGSALQKNAGSLSRDVILSDLSAFLGLLSAINLSLICMGSIWYLTDRTTQEELHQTSSLEEMRLHIRAMTIEQTGYLPWF